MGRRRGRGERKRWVEVDISQTYGEYVYIGWLRRRGPGVIGVIGLRSRVRAAERGQRGRGSRLLMAARDAATQGTYERVCGMKGWVGGWIEVDGDADGEEE